MKAWILMLLALTLPALAQAEEKKEESAEPKPAYVTLAPPFVGNYALDGGPKLRVYKADIALRVTGTEAQAAVKRNDPLIRNQLVALFSQQTVESMSSADAKEKLRQEALKQVQQVLTTEEGQPYVEDLLFNNLIAQ
ncbi:flagellar basal body-associated protein FliL [Pseudomonas sp. DTU_2021_1001937_2_SI_NGA_ILE_001]|uniref:flagellar basal body-associated protein FliL n=1 Tax=Pseudomonas sp. DTU_2021_1001937_2_SI_NGA_ILE_001 TaxID=3077589 RepID=UPI0025E2475C|nr:flagellar basal body-associated protein FliL [Pseudomonas sp. DTU_2021_1001937_2_SI_NGA_ILE_001]WNW12816.1 flagellar basal body-associated protein FliL [Pseudomonas sp. DTU_2021_1001937_2_SI_NGA_ILE_001]